MQRRPDNDNFEQWMTEWADVLTRFAYHHAGNWMTAQDIAQETFLRAYRHATAHGAYPAPGWLFRVASRLVIDESRRRSREAVGGAEVETVPLPGSFDTSMHVLEILESLSDRDRECLVLFYFRDWPIETVAKHLEIPSSTVRTRLHRARQRFRDLWEVND